MTWFVVTQDEDGDTASVIGPFPTAMDSGDWVMKHQNVLTKLNAVSPSIREAWSPSQYLNRVEWSPYPDVEDVSTEAIVEHGLQNFDFVSSVLLLNLKHNLSGKAGRICDALIQRLPTLPTMVKVIETPSTADPLDSVECPQCGYALSSSESCDLCREFKEEILS